MDTEISYTFSVVNNVSPVVDQITGSQENMQKSTDKANTNIDSQNIKFLSQLAAVTAVYGGINMVTRGMKDLGFISDKTAQSMQKVSAAVGIVAGSFNMIRGAVKVVSALKNAETALAAVETYRAVLKNPAKLALVAVAGGAAAAGVGYIAGRNSANESNQMNTTNQTNVTQNFTFSGGSASDQRSITRDTLEMMGG